MIESVVNAVQLILTALTAALALIFAITTRRREWLMTGLFAGTYFLGDLYWQLYLLFFGVTPEISYIPDLSWYASFLFLFLLLVQIGGGQKTRRPALFAIPVFTVGICIFFMKWGEYVSNIIYALLMTLILWRSIGALIAMRGAEPENKRAIYVYAAALFFCAAEYCVWISSCFWTGSTIANPYFWFDAMTSLGFVAFLPAVRKAVSE